MQEQSQLSLSGFPTRVQIEELEKLILTRPQVEFPIAHDFVDGLYARTMIIPAGMLLTGAVHKSENFLFVREGYITVWTDGNKHELQTGQMVLSKAGCKRLGLSHTHVVITTVHPNPDNIKDTDKLWEMYAVDPMPQLTTNNREVLS